MRHELVKLAALIDWEFFERLEGWPKPAAGATTAAPVP